uniref:Adenylylsulfate kinase n=1 Tax=Streptomyces sp. 31A4 TaxID=1415543 RepID=U5YRZ3_9ACTN|nr:adenylylsulfate kinase [Streptomyces sp. 31A4]
MTTAPVCTCRPGATLWLTGPAHPAVAADLASLLRTRYHRRAEVLHLPASGTHGETAEAAVRRIGMIAEILARNGILALVVPTATAAVRAAGPDAVPESGSPAVPGADAVRAAQEEVRDRHLRSGAAFLAPPAGAGVTATTAPALLALLDGHGLLPPG